MGKKAKAPPCTNCSVAQSSAVRRAALNANSTMVMSVPPGRGYPKPLPSNVQNSGYNTTMKRVYGF